MYSCPRWRGDRSGVASARARQVPVAAHEGDYRDSLRRHEVEATAAALGNAAQRNAVAAALFERAVDTRNLMCAWNYLASRGTAPGIDGIRFDDLDNEGVWHSLRELQFALQNGTYRPAKQRKVRIRKSSGNGVRTLRIPTIIDRVVQRAIVQVVQPLLDPRFDPNSHGYRPNKGRCYSLATAERMAKAGGRWVWVTEDLRDAFDHVPQQRLLDVVRSYLPNDQLCNLIETITVTEAGRGIGQGGNLSPLLLNLYLDYVLDRPWRKQKTSTPLIRVADDLLLLCTSVPEAKESRARLERLLKPTGMKLKGEEATSIRNLICGHQADWLGYLLTYRNGEVAKHISERSWAQLGNKLEVCDQDDESPLRAVSTILGWLSQQGPCWLYETPSKVFSRISATALALDFEELPPERELTLQWEKSYKRFVDLLKAKT